MFRGMSFKSPQADLKQSLSVIPSTRSFKLHASVYEVIELARLNPNMDLTEKVQNAVEKDFPVLRRYPTVEDMEDSIYRHPSDSKVRFSQGQWCEYLGLDMQWHLGQVRRVVEVAPKKWIPRVDRNPEWDYYYSFDGNDLISKNKVRAPEEALKREFGLRPWVWQQWALLKVEDQCRFQRFHERDFATMNFGMTANAYFLQWLDDDRNADFKAFFESKDAGQQDKLIKHILSPFTLMDDISKDPEDEWPMALHSGISYFLYQSLLGEGWLTCLAIVGIQFVVPAMLLYAAVARSPRFDLDFSGNNSLALFCTHNQLEEPLNAGLIINIIIIIYYLVRNLPIVMYSYFETMGDSLTVNSRINGMRTLVYYQGESTFAMMIGYRIERFMNSTYIAVVNSLMLFILFLTDDPSEIILNALAIEFVIYFDDEMVSLGLLDPGFRYLRAGTTELVFRYFIEPRKLSSAKLFCDEYDIDRQVFHEAMKENDSYSPARAMNCSSLAHVDKEDAKYMTPKDKVWKLAGKFAKESGNSVAAQLYLEYPVHFDIFSQLVDYFTGTWLEYGIFTRWTKFHTWSRWDKVLFLSPCGSEYVPPNLPSSQTKPMLYLNDKRDGDEHAVIRFLKDSILTLLGFKLAVSLISALNWRSPVSFVGRLVDGIIEWFSIAYMFVFPFSFVGFLVLLVNCY